MPCRCKAKIARPVAEIPATLSYTRQEQKRSATLANVMNTRTEREAAVGWMSLLAAGHMMNLSEADCMPTSRGGGGYERRRQDTAGSVGEHDARCISNRVYRIRRPTRRDDAI